MQDTNAEANMKIAKIIDSVARKNLERKYSDSLLRNMVSSDIKNIIKKLRK